MSHHSTSLNKTKQKYTNRIIKNCNKFWIWPDTTDLPHILDHQTSSPGNHNERETGNSYQISVDRSLLKAVLGIKTKTRHKCVGQQHQSFWVVPLYCNTSRTHSCTMKKCDTAGRRHYTWLHVRDFQLRTYRPKSVIYIWMINRRFTIIHQDLRHRCDMAYNLD